MRTKQFKRLESLLMNKPVSENLRPETGLALKKRKNTNQHVKQQRILQKLQKLNILNTYTQSDEIQYSIDQINFELKKNQSRATSEFGYQLQQRKKFRWFYGGLSTRHVQKLLKGAQSDAEIFQTLERRLDISLWRCGFFTSVYTARQWVLHKRVFVNGKVAVRPSHPLKPGDVVTIDQKWQDALKQQIFERFVKFFKNLEYTRKLNQEFPNLRSIFLTQPLNEYALQNADEGRTPNLSELNHDNTSRNYHKQFINSSLYNPISAMKPVHLEISFDIFAFVYLYVPQKMAFPMLIDLAAIRKSF
jgi:ribosomal protein S4